MKTVLIVLGILAVLGLALVGSCVFMFSRLLGPPAEAADSFIAQIAAGDVRGAYDAADPSVRDAISFEDFAANVQRIRLDAVKVAKWRSTNVNPPTAECAGIAEMRDGSVAEIEATLFKSDEWRVSGIHIDNKALLISAQEATIDNQTAAALALQTLLKWDAAVKANDFTDFYEGVADVWKRETSPDELRQAFAKFVEAEATIAGIANTDPLFTKTPNVDETGRLVMKGYYPTEPMRVIFELDYVQEGGEWKLIRINVLMSADE